MTDYKTRIRRARKWLRVRQSVADALDTVLTAGAKYFKMCGEGPKHSWSILFAQLWFTDCPCCLFYRGMTFGGIVGAFVAGAGLGAMYLAGVF